MEYTLTYSESVQGWVSFYSFIPDWMIGMNNYFYSFKGGNLYRHNTNATRNNFYGVQYNSLIKSVFNDAVLENKLFKTVSIQGDATWDALLVTDIQDTGVAERDWYEKKEQVYFSFIRNEGSTPALPSEYALRSLGGIGRSTSVSIGVGTARINFPLGVSLGSIMSIGDYFYFAVGPSYNTPLYAGRITNIVQGYTVTQNYIDINTTVPGVTAIVGQTPYFLYMKNSIAESHGVLGHYCVFTLENSNTDKVELFQFQSEVMKSYP
jgi:hypothetical protein